MTSRLPSKLIFLPGVSGNPAFWKPAAQRLVCPAQQVFFGWPGFGPTPSDPAINGIDDLVAMTVTEIDQPTALIAQSMGGVIAIRAALEKPELVTHLILSATSGGIDIASFGGEDWRPEFERENPALPPWFSSYREDLSGRLAGIKIPALLLWGDADPISPVAVGEALAALLPRASLHIVRGGKHDLAAVHAAKVAPLIDRALGVL